MYGSSYDSEENIKLEKILNPFLYEFDFSVKSLKCGNSYKSGFYC
ncbi:hypothetical protein LEP1GSC132_1808 [Leptospira kirschneri str. 200803703]|uniref:Uncharacterized protein n=1 Tax=Leptospira kirschneri str. 200802841 TaxID=1193047 RepID=A0A828Y3Q8_9LEPT|nr:hypothetical protein LEP1GSC044_2332 [Leptospira kirschneri serovar Grippotyphosa str. RM52]EKO50945.1 hypothetical protein LEP1GSC131_2397 [Leptospira kirschneri str. 200802841]EKP03553.1 hypothetical protein LEP1GSC018_3103 [Leptospira kirschneri str. 2008720114]EKQ81799.1 hypothetical protein LEP1GSC064_0160 [Leptospira kirschneri serovar Grippotyphosa str. Moskva]EKR09857.1 hypothetical protein LEP1GSC122_3179 [Leptospira kirschneri serovar Valbuzzi str. 200702274]EMK01182.1 hypothetica